MRSRRESAAILQSKLSSRPSPSVLASQGLLVSEIGSRSKLLDRKKKSEMLTSRLLSRPEKWDLHRAGVLDPEFPKEQEPEAQTKRAHVRQQREAEKKPEFSTKVDSKGTMSRSQMQREVEAADLAKKREKTIRRLANHLKNRPPKVRAECNYFCVPAPFLTFIRRRKSWRRI